MSRRSRASSSADMPFVPGAATLSVHPCPGYGRPAPSTYLRHLDPIHDAATRLWYLEEQQKRRGWPFRLWRSVPLDAGAVIEQSGTPLDVGATQAEPSTDVAEGY